MVSIVLPVFNEEKRVVGAIDSALNQTYPHVEIIVVNDGSTDSTREVIDRRYGNDERVKKIDQERKGFTKSLNRGIRISDAEYIARMDADDRCHPERFEKQVGFLEENRSVAVVGTGYLRVDDIRDENYARKYPKENKKIRKDMSKYIPLSHSSVMFRKSAIESVGGYDEDLSDHEHEDLDLWIRVAQNWELANIPEPLVVRHIRDDSYWHSNFSQHARNVHLAKLNAKAVAALSLPFYFYFFPVARLVYSYLPVAVKRAVRRLFSGIEEQDLEGSPQITSS